MKIILCILGLTASTFLLTACQTTSHEFNGQSGYRVIEQSNGSAVMSYALSGSTRNDAAKLQNACKQVLGTNKTYQVNVTNTGEIINQIESPEFGRQIGNTNTKFGLSNTPDLYNTDVSGTNAALEARPSTLRLIRFTCS
jgi:hypothetical protein